MTDQPGQRQPTAAASVSRPGSHRPGKSLWLAVVLLGSSGIMAVSTADPDLWGHVQYGRELIDSGALPQTTTWSYAESSHPWINHENIAEILMAAADSLAGQHGLLLLKAILSLVVLSGPLCVARFYRCGTLTCAVILFLTALNIKFHWHIRPHMLSYAAASIMLALLVTGLSRKGYRRGTELTRCRSERPQFGKRLWLIPLLMVFWTNSHGGFLAGMAILTAWLGINAAEEVVRRKPDRWQILRHHSALIILSWLATLVNPYGWKLHAWMLSSLGRPRPEISEWAALPLFSMQALPFWALLMLAFLSLRLTEHPKRLASLIVLALVGIMAFRHYRHLPFFALTAACVLAVHVESLLQRVSSSLTTAADRAAARAHTPRRRGRAEVVESKVQGSFQTSRAGVVTAVLCLLGISLWIAPRFRMLHVDRSFYPVAAMQYMADHHLEGNVLVSFNWAQYAIGTFARISPDSRVAIDGRFRTCYPQKLIDMHFDFLLGPPDQYPRFRERQSGMFDPTAALDYASPDLVLIERRRQNAVATMESRSADWTLLYQDEISQLWGRRARYADESSPSFIAESARHVSDDVQQGSVAWPAIPHRSQAVARHNREEGTNRY